MSGTKWQIGPVKLASGEEAFIDAINDSQVHYRYTGRIRNHAGELISAGWHATGLYMFAHTDHRLNLAPPPKKTVRVQRWMVVFLSGSTKTFFFEAEAIAEAKKHGFALIAIDREVEEGEGLS